MPALSVELNSDLHSITETSFDMSSDHNISDLPNLNPIFEMDDTVCSGLSANTFVSIDVTKRMLLMKCVSTSAGSQCNKSFYNGTSSIPLFHQAKLADMQRQNDMPLFTQDSSNNNIQYTHPSGVRCIDSSLEI